MRILVFIFTLLVYSLQSTAGNATIISGASSGLSSPDVMLTFDEIVLASNGPITNEYSGYGVTFENTYYDVQGWSLPTGRHISNFTVGITNPYMGISFTSDVTDVAFQLITNEEYNSEDPGQTTIEAWLDGALISSFVGNTFLYDQYWFGFTDLMLDEIRIYPGGWLTVGRLDNLQYNFRPSEVPLPAAFPLFIAGVCGLGFSLRKRRT